jgi:hypothetical protein
MNGVGHGHRQRELDGLNRSHGVEPRLNRGVAYDLLETSRGRGLHDHRSSHGRWCDQPMGVSREPDESPNPFQRMLDAFLLEQRRRGVEHGRLGHLHVVCPLREHSCPGVRF